MANQKVTRENLADSVKCAMTTCQTQLEATEEAATNSGLVRDLNVALRALRLIASELEGGPQRPKGQRSAQFIRYVLDEGDRMAMDPELRKMIVQIEDVYSRS